MWKVEEEFDIKTLKNQRDVHRRRINEHKKALDGELKSLAKVEKRITELEDADRVNYAFIAHIHTYGEIVGARVGILNIPRKLKPAIEMLGESKNYITLSTDFFNFNDEEAIQKHVKYLSGEYKADEVVDFRKKQRARKC